MFGKSWLNKRTMIYTLKQSSQWSSESSFEDAQTWLIQLRTSGVNLGFRGLRIQALTLTKVLLTFRIEDCVGLSQSAREETMHEHQEKLLEKSIRHKDFLPPLAPERLLMIIDQDSLRPEEMDARPQEQSFGTRGKMEYSVMCTENFGQL